MPLDVEKLEKISKVAVTMAGLVGVVWVYFDYQRDAKGGEIQKTKMDNERRIIDNDKTIALTGVERDSKIPSNNNLEIRVGKNELSIVRSRVVRGINLDVAGISQDLLKLEKEVKKDESRFSREDQISYKTDFDVKCGGRASSYSVTYNIKIDNISKRRVEISWIVIQRFVGLMVPNKHLDPFSMENPPPVLISGFFTSGPISWEEAGSDAHRYPDSPGPGGLYDFESGGGMAGVLRPGDTVEATYSFIVNGSPSDWIGIVTSWGIDRSTKGEGLFHQRDWSALPSCAAVDDGAPRSSSVEFTG